MFAYNRYMYVNGNPLNYYDSSGNRAQSADNRVFTSVNEGGGGNVAHYIYNEMTINKDSQIARAITAANNSSSPVAAGMLLAAPIIPVAAAVANTPKATALGMWAYMVGPGRDWDHKKYIRQNFGTEPTVLTIEVGSDLMLTRSFRFDVWSNIHYGYVGKSLGFSDAELLWGAGIAQLGDEAISGWFDDPIYNNRFKRGALVRLDDPFDQDSISFGIGLWNLYGDSLQYDDFLWLLFYSELTEEDYEENQQ